MNVCLYLFISYLVSMLCVALMKMNVKFVPTVSSPAGVAVCSSPRDTAVKKTERTREDVCVFITVH